MTADRLEKLSSCYTRKGSFFLESGVERENSGVATAEKQMEVKSTLFTILYYTILYYRFMYNKK